jgi:head-tail adaptor
MRAGQRDRLITIQRRTMSTTESGEQLPTWNTIAARWWASMRPVSGNERFIDPQVNAQEQVEFHVAYGTAVADISPKDRIIHPALEVGSPEPAPDDRRIHDILAVHEIGRREGLRIITRRRPDV